MQKAITKATNTTNVTAAAIFINVNILNQLLINFISSSLSTYNLSVMCARMCLDNMDKLIEQNGFITLNEPSVGGGAMVIAVA